VPEIKIPPYTPTIWHTDSDIQAIRVPFTGNFVHQWHDATNAYLQGDWELCHNLLVEIQNTPQGMKREDGPLKWLLGFIEEHDLQPPHDWEGCRTLF